MIFNVKFASLTALLALGTAILAAPAPCDEPGSGGAPGGGVGVGLSIGLGGGDGSGHHHTSSWAAASSTPAPGAPAGPGGASTPAAAPTSAAASATPTAAATTASAAASGAASPTGAAGAGSGSGSCSTGPVQCCNSVQPASSLSAAQLAKYGLVGIVLDDLDIPVGLDCDPISVIGVGGNSCSATPVCCSNISQSGLVNIGCLPVEIPL
ncbi:fungal hydrophobin-domain-containing protein [Phanerochaete sordida]|uniref:Hydrophobin n=1 Tax=Phanerochaete sordida TaxID=48140 RepID=A0A9P3LFK7_9APHY|nr:fungal hydrophobin-domain-containing protein [Phanerochaete sordida]